MTKATRQHDAGRCLVLADEKVVLFCYGQTLLSNYVCFFLGTALCVSAASRQVFAKSPVRRGSFDGGLASPQVALLSKGDSDIHGALHLI